MNKLKKYLIGGLVLAVLAVGGYSLACGLESDNGVANPVVENGAAQKVKDWDMEKSGLTNWSTVGSSATASKVAGNPSGEQGDQALRLTKGGGSDYVSQAGVYAVGTTYRLTGWARGDGTARPHIGTNLTINKWIGTTSTSWQAIDVEFTGSGNGGLYLYAYLGAATNWVEFDDIRLTVDKPQVNQGRLFKGLIGWWPLTSKWMQSATVVSGRTASGYEGNLIASPTINGQGVHLNGSTQYVYKDIADRSLEDFTISIWVKADVVNQGTAVGIYSSANSAADNRSFQIETTTGQYGFRMRDNGGVLRTDANLGAVTTDWQNFIVTSDDGVLDYYINKNHVNGGSYDTGAGMLFEELKFGANRATSNFWDGYISDWRFWDRVLSEEEANHVFDTCCHEYGVCD